MGILGRLFRREPPPISPELRDVPDGVFVVVRDAANIPRRIFIGAPYEHFVSRRGKLNKRVLHLIAFFFWQQGIPLECLAEFRVLPAGPKTTRWGTYTTFVIDFGDSGNTPRFRVNSSDISYIKSNPVKLAEDAVTYFLYTGNFITTLPRLIFNWLFSARYNVYELISGYHDIRLRGYRKWEEEAAKRPERIATSALNLCDMCNAELAPEGQPLPQGTPALTSQDMQKAVQHGFGPCIAGITFPNGGRVGTYPAAAGLTEADTDEWWRKFVPADASSWIFCSRCFPLVQRYLYEPRPDKRRPTLDFTGPLASDLPVAHGWGPGFGKTAVIFATIFQKFLESGIQVALCDICNMETQRDKLVMTDAGMLQRAIHANLDPWRTPGINVGKLNASLAAFGTDAARAYGAWRERSLRDSTDWRLCPQCHMVVVNLVERATR